MRQSCFLKPRACARRSRQSLGVLLLQILTDRPVLQFLQSYLIRNKIGTVGSDLPGTWECLAESRAGRPEGAGRDGEEVQMGLWVVIGAFFFSHAGRAPFLSSRARHVLTRTREVGDWRKNASTAHREQAGMSGIPSPPELLRILR